jgi:hypothetical protein
MNRSVARRAFVGLLTAMALLAAASSAAARSPVDPSTLNPPPPDSFNAVCFELGTGIVCDLAFSDPSIVDEPSGIVCDGTELLASQERSVVGKRFYDSDGNLLQRHFRERFSGTFTNPETGLQATWSGNTTIIHNLDVPGDVGTGTQTNTGLFSRVAGPNGETLLIENGHIVENLTTGDFSWAGNNHPFFDYFELGDSTAMEPLCAALD